MKKLLSFLFFTLILSNVSVYSQTKYKNKNLTVDERVADLLSQMTLEEKVAQMRIFHANLGIGIDAKNNLLLPVEIQKRLAFGIAGIKNPGEPFSPEQSAKLNNQLQEYIIKNNRFGIPALFITESYNGIDAHGCTRFARPMNMAATWNLDLVQKVYDVEGREARLRGLNMTHSPEADIARDPRFGRMSETFGEDTYLVTEMIVRAVKGLQGDTKGLSATHIGAVTKHFAGYAQVAGGKNFASIEISPRTLIDEIFPPFQAAIQRANTLGIMASHGDINGVASHASPYLLTEMLRNKWNFLGYTVSDSNDINRLHSFMNVAETAEDAVRMALMAGMDVDLYSEIAYSLLPEMVKKEPELIKQIDVAAGRVLRTKFILGLFENPYSDAKKAKEFTRNDAAIKLAEEADLESIILLKNNNNTLPLSKNNTQKIALVGPLLTKTTKDAFASVAGSAVTFVTEKGFELTNKANDVPQLTSEAESREGIKKIVETAKSSDKIVLFVGGDEFTSKEAFFRNALGDRDNIDPVGLQDELLLELKKTGKPIIIVLKHRRTLSINTFAANAEAIVDCWELSEFGDKSIANILFGNVCPSAKLPVTVPRSIGQLPFHYSQKEINYKKGYLFADVRPLFPFGFGLSYANFTYSNLKISSNELGLKSKLIVSVEVKNIGSITAKEVVQMYIKDIKASVVRPDKELKAFEKIELKAGETKTINFSIEPNMLEFTGLNMKKVIEKGDYEVMVGTSSTDTQKVVFRMMESSKN